MSSKDVMIRIEGPLPAFVEIAGDGSVGGNSSAAVEDLFDATKNAQRATETEHDLTTWQAVKLYPRAILCSVILSFAIIMEGYDTALLGNFYGLPAFRQRFGVQLPNGDWQITSSWQSGLQNGANIGQILGLLLAGIIADRYGYKRTMIGALVMISAAIFLLFFAQDIGMLMAGEIMCGIPLGAFQTITTTYAADVTPIALRPILTSFVNLCWVIGQFVAAGVLRGILTREDQWAWRIPYAIQWAWPVPIIIGVLFAPESPCWLIRQGQIERSRAALRHLASSSVSNESIDNTLQLMILTNEHERRIEEGTSYRECLRGTNRRRTEIACLTWVIQVSCGIWFGGNIVYFLEQAGFDPTKAFDFGLGTNAIAVIGTVSSWFVMPRVGRRRLYLVGLAVLLTCLLVVGFLGIPPASNRALGWVSAAFLIMFVFTYDLTIGPVCYCLVSEIPSTRLRVKTVVLARNAYNVASICANLINPPMINPASWNLRGKTGFVWAAFCLISLLWTYFRLPEPKGRTPAEMDLLFETGVKARKSSTATVDLFRSDDISVAVDTD